MQDYTQRIVVDRMIAERMAAAAQERQARQARQARTRRDGSVTFGRSIVAAVAAAAGRLGAAGRGLGQPNRSGIARA